MMWKPREEYKTLAEKHNPILTRCRPDPRFQYLPYGPMVVIWSTSGSATGGHFYPCPGVPMFYGNNQLGFMTHDNFDEWMEIPE